MNLRDISKKYQKNLVSFFNNPQVIDEIYKEQYGEEDYNINKTKYIEEYNNIMNNTVFIPYITLEHLENYIDSYRKNIEKSVNSLQRNKSIQERKLTVEKIVNDNLKEECNLLKSLYIEKQKIIKNYNSFLLNELKEKMPKLSDSEYNEISKQFTNLDFSKDITSIQNTIYENNKSLFAKSKNNKLNKYLNKYYKLAKDKILIETSSYFNHRADIPSNKYYIDIIQSMSNGGQFVTPKIGRDSSKNIRYIFLPVLTYTDKKHYLTNAIHEVMHISKEQVHKSKYQSGLFENNIAHNKNISRLTVNDNLLSNFIQKIKWFNFTKSINLPRKENYYISSGHESVEEVTHHWQARNVVNNILKNNLSNLLYMPYNNMNSHKIISTYEYFDKSTEYFMNNFRQDIQKINNGQLSLRKFKNKIGRTNFELFSQASNLCTTSHYTTSKNSSTLFTKIMDNLHKTDISNILLENRNYNVLTSEQDTYTNIGNKAVERMINTSSKRTKILEKTKSIASTNICEIGKLLQTKLKSKQHIIEDNESR